MVLMEQEERTMAHKADQPTPRISKKGINWQASVDTARRARAQAKESRKGKTPSLRRWATRTAK